MATFPLINTMVLLNSSIFYDKPVNMPKGDQYNAYCGLSSIVEHPWVVQLVYKKNNKCLSQSTLIHPSVLLTDWKTPGVYPYNDLLFARAGVGNNNQIPFQEREVCRGIRHPEYNFSNSNNDIALLILAEPFILTDYVNTICLNPPLQGLKFFQNCKRVECCGNEILKINPLKVLEIPECEEYMKHSGKYNITEDKVCAFPPNYEDIVIVPGTAMPCETNPADGRYYLVGTLSTYYPRPNDRGYSIGTLPLYFSSIYKQRIWIDQKMKEAGYSFDMGNIYQMETNLTFS